MNCYVICLTLSQALTAGARRKLSLLLPHKRFICSNFCRGSSILFAFCITNLWRWQKVLSSFKFSLHAQIINFQNSEQWEMNKPKTGKKCVFAVITIKFMYNYLYKVCAVCRAYKYSKFQALIYIIFFRSVFFGAVHWWATQSDTNLHGITLNWVLWQIIIYGLPVHRYIDIIHYTLYIIVGLLADSCGVQIFISNEHLSNGHKLNIRYENFRFRKVI